MSSAPRVMVHLVKCCLNHFVTWCSLTGTFTSHLLYHESWLCSWIWSSVRASWSHLIMTSTCPLGRWKVSRAIVSLYLFAKWTNHQSNNLTLMWNLIPLVVYLSLLLPHQNFSHISHPISCSVEFFGWHNTYWIL